jgi:hypothetical protein
MTMFSPFSAHFDAKPPYTLAHIRVIYPPRRYNRSRS